MARIDLPTLFMVSTALFILMAGMFFITWRQDRSANAAMLHWALSHLLGAPACVLLALRGQIDGWLSIGVANVIVLTAFGLVLAGALTFEGRRGHLVAVVLPPAIWIVATRFPAVWDHFSTRVVLISSMIFTLAAATAVVIWRGRNREPLPSRPIVALLFGFVAVAHLARLLLTANEPPSESFAVLGSGWTAFIAMQILLQEVVLGYALLSMVKERGEARHRRTAEIDSLTGVLTRRSFFERASARLAGDPSRGAVLVFDLDRFKSINDTHGHLVGDRVLADFARVASARLGPQDLLGRFGGEEFVLFLATADLSAAWRFADDVRREFAALGIRNAGHVIDATVSVGVAAVPLIEPDLDRLVASADAGLYAAKQAGRDRVEMVAPPERWSPRRRAGPGLP
jgi:diguanylate cyclase (GGDEF)-like protein